MDRTTVTSMLSGIADPRTAAGASVLILRMVDIWENPGGAVHGLPLLGLWSPPVGIKGTEDER